MTVKLYRVENHSDREIRLDDGTVIPPRGSAIIDNIRPSLNVQYLKVKMVEFNPSELDDLRHALEKEKLRNESLNALIAQLKDEIARLERVMTMFDRHNMPLMAVTAPNTSNPVETSETPRFQVTPMLADTSGLKASIAKAPVRETIDLNEKKARLKKLKPTS